MEDLYKTECGSPLVGWQPRHSPWVGNPVTATAAAESVQKRVGGHYASNSHAINSSVRDVVKTQGRRRQGRMFRTWVTRIRWGRGRLEISSVHVTTNASIFLKQEFPLAGTKEFQNMRRWLVPDCDET